MILRTPPRCRLLGLLLLVCFSLWGCVDYRLVRDIVRESDAELLGAELGRAADAELKGDNPRVRRGSPDQSRLLQISALVDRIDTFTAEHPGADRTNAALAMRKALLLLEADRYEASRAAFADIPAADLAGERDRLLHALGDDWVWWHQTVDASAQPSRAQLQTRASAIAAALDARPNLTPALSDWFEFFGAQVALKEVRMYAEGPERGATLVAAIARYFRRYSVEEQEWILLWSREPAALSAEERQNLTMAPLERLRGFDLARSLAAEARLLARDLELEGLPWPEEIVWVDQITANATRPRRE